jgi:hypothetical protein
VASPKSLLLSPVMLTSIQRVLIWEYFNILCLIWF